MVEPVEVVCATPGHTHTFVPTRENQMYFSAKCRAEALWQKRMARNLEMRAERIRHIPIGPDIVQVSSTVEPLEIRTGVGVPMHTSQHHREDSLSA